LSPISSWLASPVSWHTLGGLALKFHHPLISGGDRKALTKELVKSRAMTKTFAERSAEKRRGGKALIREADNLSWPIMLQEMFTAAQQEFEYAIQFHEVWKIAADDSDLHRRTGRSYASQAFLIIRSAIRREMLLALMRLWDRNKQAICITWVVATLGEEKDLVPALTADRVRGNWPGVPNYMLSGPPRRDIRAGA
jgi:AbiU2